MKKGLASDNYAGVLPEILEAIAEASRFHAKSYGYDDFTEKARQEFVKHFGSDVEVTFVFNGTGANVLGIGCATESFNSILCADISHLYVDESTAPETFTGCRLVPLATNSEGKIEIETIRNSIIRKGDEHYPQVKVFSLTQPTEYGTVYTREELLAIGRLLKEHDFVFHMDGARLFNAAVSLKCSLKEMTRDAGVDILSVGGTKIGLLFGEAVVFFNKNYSQNLRYRQKQSMQLPSKMRFISAQFHRLLRDKIWIKSATHANEMAKRLFEGVKDVQKIKITRTVQANSVFAIIPVEWNELLQDLMPFHIWNENTNEVRWMCGFDTEENAIDEFISLVCKLDNI
ncbi:MAG TPA: aminotransferase class I/II-fold pyridoxal phosphate-dependent enzyme [Pyrinomonadaceae bacterium]|nr:aminotransferase class I/II-fold pyridoxal phosphate-dependent enzyme [Pyrinomonadaceae bacterium]